ncbi:MAG: metalloregulator ArsR/SmtB family transcription factor [Candidatus Latescibacter sp.]|nr:metalloregulator ArsR/SmtB family transcription factor [Candidatus Latescibacter sp.]
MSDLFVRHAEICKTFSNPRRLEIISALRDKKELTASQLLELIDTSKANLSQHMAVLVQKGVVKSRREGINVFYQLSDERITKACDIMREVLIGRLESEAKALDQFKK